MRSDDPGVPGDGRRPSPAPGLGASRDLVVEGELFPEPSTRGGQQRSLTRGVASVTIRAGRYADYSLALKEEAGDEVKVEDLLPHGVERLVWQKLSLV